MTMVLTLIVKPHNARALQKFLDGAVACLKASGCTIGAVTSLSEGEALDLLFDGTADLSALSGVLDGADWAVQNTETRDKRMLIADMDSTMIAVECIDELADFAGKKEQVAAITEAAMGGDLDFSGSLTERVALLKGLPLATLQLCYDERVRLTPGAKELIATLNHAGFLTVLVSGGFTFFADRVAATLGFGMSKANNLGVADDALTGKVIPPIVNAETKLATLEALQAKHGFKSYDIMAVGDGANDIAMIEAAGLGVSYHATPRTAAAADVSIQQGDLTALLFLLGFKRADFIS